MDKIEKANACMASGETEKGLSMLRDLVSDPDDAIAFEAASIYQNYGFLDEAEAVYKRLLASYPDDSELLLQVSDLLIDKDQEDQAIDYLLQISSGDGNYLSAQVLLAELYQLEGLDEVAERKLKHALKISPGNPLLLDALGEFYLSCGQPANAATCFEAIVENKMLADQNIDLKLAEAYSLCGKFEEALTAYQKGLKKEKRLDSLFGYAMAASRLQKNTIVISSLEELRELDPGYSTLYPVLANAYKQEGQLEKALQIAEAGLEQDEYNNRLFTEAANLAAASHQNEKAAYYFQKCLELDPENTQSLIRLIELYAQNGDYQSIIKQLEKRHPEDPMLQWFLATAYNQEDRLDEAGHYYQACSSHFSGNPEFLREYGDYLRDIGNAEKGLILLERALKLNPENDELAEFINRLKQDDFD